LEAIAVKTQSVGIWFSASGSWHLVLGSWDLVLPSSMFLSGETRASVELTVVLPAYNEGRAVYRAAEACVLALQECCSTFEILIVNDASTDDTPAFAKEVAERHPCIRVLNNARNLGQPASMLRGFSQAAGHIIMHNAVDLPFNPEDTKTVLERMRAGADVVVVERKDRRAYGLFRKATSWCNIALIKMLFGSPFRDHNFVQAYRRRVLDSIDVRTRGVSNPPVELVLKALALGFRVDRIEAHYARRTTGKSSVTLKKIFHTTIELFYLWLIMLRWRPGCRRSAW
jgi:glycosyltransferase involved in cell wall biosynthesis